MIAGLSVWRWLALCVALCVFETAHAESGRVYDLDLPAQSVTDALTRLSEQTGVPVVFSSDLTRNRSARPVRGRYTLAQALDALLAGTGLSGGLSDKGVLTISRSGADRHSRGETMLTQSELRAENTNPVRARGIAAFFAAIAASFAASAQQNEDAPLEEITVTAQKRTERQQDVPVPVSVLNAGALATNNQVLLRDYYNTVPGLNLVANYGFTQNLAIRGVTTGGFSNPTVGVIIDDVPYGSPINNSGGQQIPDVDPGDLSQIEVLRGPQGTLYGANSMGGLIKYVTKDPTFAGLDGRIEAGLSSAHEGSTGHNFRAAANVPLTDTFAVRVSGYTRRDPGYIDNPVLGLSDLNDADSKSGRISGLWKPAEALSIKLSALYQRTDTHGVSDVHPPTAGFPRTAGLGELEQNNMPGSGSSEREIRAYSASVQAGLRFATLTSITGYNTNQTLNTFDRSDNYGAQVIRDFGAGVADGLKIFDWYDIQRFTQELRLTDSIGRFDWMLGGFYSDVDARGQQTLNAARRDTGAVVGLEWYRDNPLEVQERAVFANAGVRLTEKLDVQFGGRQSWTEENDGVYTQRGPYPYNGRVPSFPPPPILAAPISSKANTFTYLTTARYRFAPDLMLYGRLASGYRPGGPNFFIAGAPAQYAPDKTRNYEIGVKGDLLGRLLSIDASVYYIDWEDLQIQLRDPATQATYQTNGSRAKSQGIELGLTARPLAGLSISGWIAYNDAVLTEPFPPAGTTYGIEGDRLPNSPRRSGYVSVNQQFPLGAHTTGFVSGSLTYTGERISLFTSTPVRQVFPSYTKTDLRAGFTFESWTANLFVNNVTDERGVLGGGLSYQPSYAVIYIQPRTIGVSLSKDF